MDKCAKILLSTLLLCLLHAFAFAQSEKQKPRIKFKTNIIHLSTDEGITYRGDTIYAKFEYYNINPPSPLTIEFVKPSCTCTGYKLTEPKQQGENGTIELVFTRASIEKFGIMDAIVKSDAVNNYELLEVTY